VIYQNTLASACSLLQSATNMHLFKLSILLINLFLFTNNAIAADPWKIIVPTAAAGSTDVLTRALGERISKYLGEPVEIENMPGNSGSIAANKVFASDPNTKILVMATVSSHAIAFGLTPNPSYKADGFPR